MRLTSEDNILAPWVTCFASRFPEVASLNPSRTAVPHPALETSSAEEESREGSNRLSHK